MIILRVVGLFKLLAQDPEPHVPILHSRHQSPGPPCATPEAAALDHRVSEAGTHSLLPLLDMKWTLLSGEATDTAFSPRPQAPRASGDNRGRPVDEKPFLSPRAELHFLLTS